MTTASYERLNYRLRPAKHVERGMIFEALQRLRMFAPLRQYRYVGFGSLYFADFILVHRALGIKSMICVEKDEEQKARFQFNRPFRTVVLRFGHSNDVLPALGWSQRTIVWLDYDGKLDRQVLADIGWVCGAAPSGSVLVVTVNAHPAPSGERVTKLREAIGRENVPSDVKHEGDLAGWRTAEVARTVIDSSIREALHDRSVPGDRFFYEQLFNFHYSDGARMATVGGVIASGEERRRLKSCEFRDLDYVCDGVEAFKLDVPFLTNREIRLLDRHLPATRKPNRLKMLPEDAESAYRATYRFFPTFVDAEF